MMDLSRVQILALFLGPYIALANCLHVFQPNNTVINSSCGMSCQLFFEIGPPPDLILTIPPPPLPFSFVDMQHSSQVESSDEKCNFCEWAKSGLDEIPIHKKSGFHDNSWIVIAVIISVLSAIVAFVLILVILQCNNIKIFPVSACPILSGSSSAKKPPPQPEEKPSPTLVRKEQVRPFAHLWHQGNSQEKPLQTPSSQCSEANSYSGEPYRCESVDSQPVYSEINIRSETSSTIYSEVVDQPPPLPPVLGPINKLLTDAAYENAAFNSTFEQSRAHKMKRLPLPTAVKPSREEMIRNESPYYYKQPDQHLPARKPLPLLPSQRMRSLPRRPLPNTPSPAMV